MRQINSDELVTPCYVVSSNGFRDSLSYEDGWCYGASEHLGTSADDCEIMRMLHADIRSPMPR